MASIPLMALMVGASIALIPGFLGAKLFFKGLNLAPNALCHRLYAAAFLKWITTLLLFALVFAYFEFEAYALFLGFIIAQGIFAIVVNWIASKCSQ